MKTNRRPRAHVKAKPSRSGPVKPQAARQIVDAADLAMLRALKEDARMPVTELARRANVSRANAYTRLERLTDAGVIEGYQVRVNPRAVGLEVTALIFLNIEQGRWREVRDRLVDIPEIQFVGLAAGDFDFVVLVRATSADTLRDVVLERFVTMPEVRNSRTVFLLDDIERGPILPQ
jgi:DNA-binding Lrp family transcriptional regulator